MADQPAERDEFLDKILAHSDRQYVSADSPAYILMRRELSRLMYDQWQAGYRQALIDGRVAEDALRWLRAQKP